LLAEELSVADRKLDRLGQQEALAGGIAAFEAVKDLLEEDTFMGGVLIEQDKSAVGFEDGVEAANDTDVAQRHGEQRQRR
jgi:hypothetical protein